MTFETMSSLNLCITLRCNANCRNCMKFCNKEEITGLDYSDSDMTLGQIDNFISHVEKLGGKPVFDCLDITGGEPLLHPDFEEIVYKMEALKEQGYINRIIIDSNLTIPAPTAVRKYIRNDSTPEKNPEIHKVVFLHPLEFGGAPNYKYCVQKRKRTVVLTYQGYSLCCAGDAYIRLFGFEDLILDYLPESISSFPRGEMNKVCMHCPFGNFHSIPFEKDMGCPVSDIYKMEAEKNRGGRRITKRFPERMRV